MSSHNTPRFGKHSILPPIQKSGTIIFHADEQGSQPHTPLLSEGWASPATNSTRKRRSGWWDNKNMQLEIPKIKELIRVDMHEADNEIIAKAAERTITPRVKESSFIKEKNERAQSVSSFKSARRVPEADVWKHNEVAQFLFEQEYLESLSSLVENMPTVDSKFQRLKRFWSIQLNLALKRFEECIKFVQYYFLDSFSIVANTEK